MYKGFYTTTFFIIAVLVCLFSFSTKALAADGAIDQTFNSNGSGGQLSGFNGTVGFTDIQTDGKIIVGGNFTSYDGTTGIGYITRLNADGTIDSTFNVGGAGFNAAPAQMELQTDGKIVVTGGFTTYDTVTANRIVRLNSDGSLDTTFATNVGTGMSAATRGLWVDNVSGANLGKILVGGSFATINGAPSKFLARLNSDGTPDTAFNANIGSTGFNNTVQRLAVQSTDKIIVAGQFTTALGHTVHGITRLNSDGTFDATWNPSGAGTNGSVYSIKVMPNNQILVGGAFNTYNGVSTLFFIRLNSDGTLDSTFNTGGTGANGEVDGIFLQPNGKIIIEGSGLTNYNGTAVTYIARLNSDGTLDTTFSLPGTGFGGPGILNGADGDTVNEFRANGSMIVGTYSNVYNGTSYGYILALQMDDTNPVFSNIHIASSNTNTLYAKSGDIITLSFASNHPLTASTITINGRPATASCVAGSGTTVNCTAPLTVLFSDSNGVVPFSISGTTVGGTSTASATTDSSSVTVITATPAPATITVVTPTLVTTPTISGTCITGDTVTVTVSTQTLTTSCSGGTYSTVPSALAAGAYTVGVTQSDIAGNASTQATTPLVVTAAASAVIQTNSAILLYGCKIPSAVNYNPDLAIAANNALCLYASMNLQCQDPQASNYSTGGLSDPALCMYRAAPAVAQASVSGAPGSGNLFLVNLKQGAINSDILRLQHFLNTHKFPVASYGAGSLNQETMLFGQKTFHALTSYQAVIGLPATGYFGPMTRAYLNALIASGK